MGDEKFFNWCVWNLVNMLSYYAEEKFGTIADGCRYIVWQSTYEGYPVINVSYRGILLQFKIDDDRLILVNTKNIEVGNCKERVETVATECIERLMSYHTPISKVEGLLTHGVLPIRKLNSGLRKGELDIFIGV